MSVTHVAANCASIGDRIIQRCCICGEKLVDGKPNCVNVVAVDVHGNKVYLTAFPMGQLVRCDECDMTIVDRFPDDNCLVLVEN